MQQADYVVVIFAGISVFGVLLYFLLTELKQCFNDTER